MAPEGELPPVHDKHNLASASPVTDGERVYAWFGTGQIVALDVNGKPVWSKHLGKEYGSFDIQWGHASSPVLFEDSIILLCYHAPALVHRRARQAHRRGEVEGRQAGGAGIVQLADRRAGSRRQRADRQLEHRRRVVRSGDGQVAVDAIPK